VKRASKIFLVIGIIIGGLIVNVFASDYIRNYDEQIRTEEYLSKQSTISVTGIIQYKQTDGWSFYSIMPEENVDFEINEFDGIYLSGFVKIEASPKDERVVVTGKLIENYEDFHKETLGRSFMGDPLTATILVDQIKTLDNTD